MTKSPSGPLHTGSAPAHAAGDRLQSWKEIATYLRREVRTVHRWEAGEGLPVYRHLHRARSSVYAYRSDLDAWLTSRRPRRSDPPARRVMLAALPFVDIGDDPRQAYFSDGLTEALIAQLGRSSARHFGVIARTSVMKFKDTRTGVDQIGRRLGVDYVIEGSVRHSSHRVRVTAQLIRVADQSHVWAECYDRHVSDVLSLQQEIALAIARQLDARGIPGNGGPPAGTRRVDLEAYEAYLKGRFHWYKLSREHLDIALDYFRLALKRDPDCALAHAGIAYVWLSRGDCGLMPSHEAVSKAKASVMKALALDDTLPDVHEILAGVKLHADWDWDGAEQAYRRAIELNPSRADCHFFYADLLISSGRLEQGMAETFRALELDPLNSLFHCFLGWYLVYQRRFDEAIERLEHTLKTEPRYPAAHLGLWGAFFQKRMYGEALERARRFFDVLGDQQLCEALTHGGDEAGYAAAMLRAAEILVARARHAHVPALRVARMYAHAGESEQALDWLEKAHAAHEAPLVHLGVAWDWDGLRNHPKFERLLRATNLPAEERA